MSTATKLQLGEILKNKGLITDEQIEMVLTQQSDTGHKKLLGELLIENDYCTENDIASALAEAYGVPYAQISPKICDPNIIEVLPREFLEEHIALPLFKIYNTLIIALNEPSNVFLIEEIERLSKCDVKVVCASAKDIQATLQAYMPASNVFVIDDIIDETGLDDFALIENITEDISNLEEVAGQSPVVKLVNYLIFNAVHENASDIHIEPDNKKLRVRYRVDGQLYEKMRPPHQMLSAIISRIKIMAELDIAQRRLPQDGGIHVMVEGRPVDLRVSVMPGNFGEKVVIRVLDTQKTVYNLETLGFSYDNLSLLKEKIQSPNGIFLVTGPTGSGKNTTLYGILSELNSDEVNISTVEDPIEANISCINQFEVNNISGFTFGSALKSLLRQDPDVLMIGEIRDAETANIAVQAALTGHMVLSTLHTNNAPGAVTRFVDLGVAAYLVGASLTGVLAQRLVRKVCSNCKEVYEPPIATMKIVEKAIGPVPKYYRGIGCKKCRNTGYLGRIAIHELFVPDNEIKDMIIKEAQVADIKERAIAKGMSSLRIDGLQKVKAGITTVDEVLRVSHED